MTGITLDDFLARIDEWRDLFVEKLEEILGEEVEFEDAEEDTLWGQIPAIDSKSVVQLNPIVEEELDITLKPDQWIKSGGFDSIGEAVDALLAAIKSEL